MALRELNKRASHQHAQQQHSRGSFLRRIIWVCLVLLLLAVVAGLVYTWWMGKNRPVAVTNTQLSSKKPAPKATPVVDEGAPVGVAVEAMSPAMKAGSNASISIKTKPKAACSIVVTYKDQKSTDAGLIPKNADEFGVVMWTWSVEIGRPVGEWPVEVTCAYNGRSGYGKEMLKITSST